jgi:hypothetical protein
LDGRRISTSVNTGRVNPSNGADEAEDGNWAIPAKDYASRRFSGLDQMNATSANRIYTSEPRLNSVIRITETSAGA